eukprot:6201083-Pleurochrysis_carterae.AAC.2
MCQRVRDEAARNSASACTERCCRHFADNWVIAYYMGNLVELCHAWEPYKAAKTALSNTTQPATVRTRSSGPGSVPLRDGCHVRRGCVLSR